uniref:m7GpppX diphosphatase n=1 Tax=Dracunculus medinensis TaxID=318479 RepID=A0A0N4U6H8_DRAME
LLQSNSNENAIIIAEKTPFPADTNSLQAIITNIDFNNFMMFFFEGIKSSLIYPCTDMHIEKYRKQNRCLIQESADDYYNITLPYIQSNQLSVEWVYNVLDKKCESERIIFDNPDQINGFMLLPDLKWNGIDIENLYVQAIVYRRTIKSVRDLKEEHLPLLKNIREQGLKTVEEKYNVHRQQIRMYLHYQPSYYHLHVHFVHISYDAAANNVGKAILLDDVINNISLMADYYQKTSLTFEIKENHPLAKHYRKLKLEN